MAKADCNDQKARVRGGTSCRQKPNRGGPSRGRYCAIRDTERDMPRQRHKRRRKTHAPGARERTTPSQGGEHQKALIKTSLPEGRRKRVKHPFWTKEGRTASVRSPSKKAKIRAIYRQRKESCRGKEPIAAAVSKQGFLSAGGNVSAKKSTRKR